MAAKISLITAAVIAALAAGGTPTPSYSLDFSSALPSQVTFTRSGSRTAIVSGALTTVSANTPALESISSGALGISIEPASTNQILQSNTFNTTWTLPSAGVTLTSGQPSPDGGSNGWDVAETTITNYHEVRQDLAGVSSGTIMCTSVFVKAKSGSAATNSVGVHNSNQFNNTGAKVTGILDASAAAYAYDVAAIGGGTATFNSVSGGSQRLAGGWTRIWCVGTATVTGTKTIRLRTNSAIASGQFDNYLGVAANGYEVAFAQTEFGVSRPTSYKATTTATASTSADSAIISDLTWLNTAQGTLLIEHDCTAGVLLGSGTNTVLSGATGAVPPNRITGKVAIAWSGTTSDLVYNGGSNTTGSQPTFGSDIRLLATSATVNSGHIKSLKYYPSRLSVAQIQALTAPSSTAPAAGTWRVATHRNVTNNSTVTIPGTTPYQAFVWPANIGSGDRSKLRISAGNWYLTDATGDTNTGNTITIESAVLIRVSTGEFAPIYWGGLRSITLTNGQVKANSDDILPSAFSSLTAGGKFPNLEQFLVKGKVKCTSGGKLPVGRWGQETGAQCWQYDSAVTTISAVDASGNFTLTSGTAATTSTKGFSMVVEGPFVSGDPMTLTGYGDSIVEGVGGTLQQGGTWFQKAANALGLAYLQCALGGQSQIMFWKSTNINSYVGLGNVLVDNTGTNTLGPVYYPLPYYNAYQAGIRYILRPSLNVRTTATGPVSAISGDGTTATATVGSAYLANIGSVGTVFNGFISGVTGATGFNTNTTTFPSGIAMTIATTTTVTFASTTTGAAGGTMLINDLFRDNGNQTVSLPYPDSNAIALVSLAANGFIDKYYKMNAVRDTGDKWISNGTTQGYTVDGTHQQSAGDDLMATELQTQLAAVVLV